MKIKKVISKDEYEAAFINSMRNSVLNLELSGIILYNVPTKVLIGRVLFESI